LGAGGGEIPAASAGMTELGRAGVAGTGLGARGGEIPAASAGMTELLARVGRSLLARVGRSLLARV